MGDVPSVGARDEASTCCFDAVRSPRRGPVTAETDFSNFAGFGDEACGACAMSIADAVGFDSGGQTQVSGAASRHLGTYPHEVLIVRNTFFDVSLPTPRHRKRASSAPAVLPSSVAAPSIDLHLCQVNKTLSRMEAERDALLKSLLVADRSLCQLETEHYWRCCKLASRMLVMKVYHGVRWWYGVDGAMSLALGMPRERCAEFGGYSSLQHMSHIAMTLADVFPRGFFVILLPALRIFRLAPGAGHSEASAFHVLVEMQGCRWREACVFVAFGIQGRFWRVLLAAVWCPWWSALSRLDPADAHGSGLLWYCEKRGYGLRALNSHFRCSQR
jgi:hypothetical protein